MTLFQRNKKQEKARGASSRKPKPSREINWARLYPVAFLLLLLMVFAGVYRGGLVLVSQPVKRVVVNGEFLYVDKKNVAAEVEPFLVEGFVMLDLEGIRQQLVQQPWIFDVSVVRHWPDEIVINVTEQSPIARWGEDSYLNHRGEVFKPRRGNDLVGDLPHLQGPENSTDRVMSHFSQLSKVLAAQQLGVARLLLDERDNWSLHLDNDIHIVLGRGAVMEKLRRLLFAYELGLSSRFAQIKSIDMRYSNGFAVAWREQNS